MTGVCFVTILESGSLSFRGRRGRVPLWPCPLARGRPPSPCVLTRPLLCASVSQSSLFVGTLVVVAWGPPSEPRFSCHLFEEPIHKRGHIPKLEIKMSTWIWR